MQSLLLRETELKVLLWYKCHLECTEEILVHCQKQIIGQSFSLRS